MSGFDLSRRARVAPLPDVEASKVPDGATLLSDVHAVERGWLDPSSLTSPGHLLVPAPTGGGKSALLMNVLTSRKSDHLSLHFLCADRKGEAMEYGLPMTALRNVSALQTTCYINLFAPDGAPGRVPMNLAKANYGDAPRRLIAQSLAHLISKTAAGEAQSGSASYRIQAVLVSVVWAVLCADHPSRSLLWAADCLTLPDGIARLAALVPDEEVRVELQSVQSSPSDARAGALARLRVLNGWDGLAAQLGAGSCIDFGNLARTSDVYIDLANAPAGSDQVVLTFGNLLVEQFARALLRRPPPGFPPGVTTCFIDEALQFAPALTTIARPILETGRSFGVELWLSAQHLRGLRDLGTVWDAIIANSHRLVGAVGAEDASLIAREQYGSAGDPRASAMIRRIAAMKPRDFCLAARDRVQFFRSADIDFRALEKARRKHEDQFQEVYWRLSPRVLPRPVRLWEVGGPRVDTFASVHPSSETPRPPKRPRSRFG